MVDAGALSVRVQRAIRDVSDFPAPGVLFRDITPVLADCALLRAIIAHMAAPFAGKVTHVVGIESRGFLFGVPIALSLGAAFVPARKPAKLPCAVVRELYSLEYRTDALEMHRDALSTASRVLIVDDVIATGGTIAAAERLVGQLSATVIGVATLLELGFLRGRAAIQSRNVTAVVTY